MKKFKLQDLPTWEICDKIHNNEVIPPNALEKFIYNNEPALQTRCNDDEWRESLVSMINYVLEKYSDR